MGLRVAKDAILYDNCVSLTYLAGVGDNEIWPGIGFFAGLLEDDGLSTGPGSKATKAASQAPPGASGTAAALFAQSWSRFVSEALADWQRADLSALLSATDGLEDKVKIVHAELSQRPEDSEFFRKAVGSQRKAKEPPPLENSIRMYGVMNTVAYTLLCKLGDFMDPKALPRDPTTGAFAGNPQSLLPCVARVRDLFAQDDARCRDSAVAAALLFDLLALNNQKETSAELRLKVAGAVERGFERALNSIRLGQALARRMKRLELESEIPATLLLFEAGQAAAAAYLPGYADSSREWAKRNDSPTRRFVEELRTFGPASHAFAQACGWIAPVLEPASVAASAVLAPYGLTTSKERSTADLAGLCLLAHYLSTRPALLASQVACKASKLRPEFSLLEVSFVPAQVAKEASGEKKGEVA